jgi:hypothetical protein
VIVVAVLGACVGEDNSRLDRATAEDTCRSYCDATCDCDPECTGGSSCFEFCFDQVHWYYRTSAWARTMECYAEHACEVTNGCTECEPTSAHRAFEAECVEVLQACGHPADTVEWMCVVTPQDDENGTGRICLLVPEVMEQDMTECLTFPCVDVVDCLADVRARFGGGI